MRTIFKKMINIPPPSTSDSFIHFFQSLKCKKKKPISCGVNHFDTKKELKKKKFQQ